MILTRNNRLTKEELAIDETVLTTQNGYLGIRASFEENGLDLSSHRGCYLNGVYDTEPIPYGEKAYGFPETTETIVNLPDTQTIEVYLNDEPVNLHSAKILKLKRAFDLENGWVLRSVLYETKEGYQLWFHSKRITHLKHLPLFMIDFTIESVNYEGKITIESSLNPHVHNFSDASDIRVNSKKNTYLNVLATEIKNKNNGVLKVQTLNSKIDIAVIMTHSTDFDLTIVDGVIKAKKQRYIGKDSPVQFQKKVIYLNTLYTKELNQSIQKWLQFLSTTSLEEIYASHIKALKILKPIQTLKITSNKKDLNETIHYALYQLYMSGASHEWVNIPAKGLTGEGYQGHTFWDTEIYMLPFFMQVDPIKAKSLLIHRYHQLDHARNEARILGVEEGVKFAWRTITGKETSSYYPASTAQYHINSAIAYAVIQYDKLFQDVTFMNDYGFELLLETARFFKSVVHEYEGYFHLHHVTGPDEYSAVVDDNYYTNRMLKYHLSHLISYIEKEGLKVDADELNLFKAIEERIFLPFDETLNIDVQDASFLSKKPFDFKNLPETKKPLLLHFHPLTIYRHQILKQADTILSHLLLFDRPLDVMNDSMAYYEPKTIHDSSLSDCVHAAQYAKLSDLDKALHYFDKTLRIDLDNTHKNTFHGLHVANLGGIYFSLLYGFIGYEIKDLIHVSPKLPKTWDQLTLSFRLIQSGHVLLHMTHEQLELTASKDTHIKVHGQEVTLLKDTKKVIPQIWF